MGQFDTERATHIPVLLNECLDLLAPAFETESPLMVDATVGLGGHTEAALRRFADLRVIGIDRDKEALTFASERLARFGPRFIPFHGTYDQIEEALDGDVADGVLMDLGISSMQIDLSERGFSYSIDAPLDMRMDLTSPRTAADILNQVDESELSRLIWQGGQERFARQIARNVVKQREVEPITRTSELVEIIKDSIPAPARRTGGNPSKRTFQALRIAVNDELRILGDALPAALANLRVGGRIVVESYQSLEDQIVKSTFVKGARSSVPPGVPVTSEQALQGVRLRILTPKAIKANPDEVSDNPRSASVRLRGAELVSPWRSDA